MSDIGMDDGPHPASSAPLSAGERLREAREAQGLSIADIAARTRIPQRHLEAIETGNYRALPSATYAVGFARAYARAVGVDEVALAATVRDESDRQGKRTPDYVPYEMADPARVPSRGLAIAALGVALAIVILAGLWYATDWFRSPGAESASAPIAASEPVAPPTVAPTPTPVAGGQVTLTATDDVWLRVYDADDKTLYLGTMHAGDRFDVPAAARDPKINVGRPDKLQVTLNGSAIPPLGDGSRPIKDVAVGAPAIAARLNAAPAAGGPTPAPAATVNGM